MYLSILTRFALFCSRMRFRWFSQNLAEFIIFLAAFYPFLALFVRNDRYTFHLSILAEYALFCLRRYATHNKHLLMLSDAKTLYRKHFFCSFFHFLFAFVVRNDRYKVFLSILALFFRSKRCASKKLPTTNVQKSTPTCTKKWCQMYVVHLHVHKMVPNVHKRVPILHTRRSLVYVH